MNRVFTIAKLIWRLPEMSAAFDRLSASVANEKTAVDSAIALLSGLSAALRAAIASTDETALSALADSIDSETGNLSAALAANIIATTPAAAVANNAADSAKAANPDAVQAGSGSETGVTGAGSTGAGSAGEVAADLDPKTTDETTKNTDGKPTESNSGGEVDPATGLPATSV